MADLLAVRGASLHPSALPLAEDQEQRKAFIKDLQKMYLSILKEQGQDTADIEDAMAPEVGAFAQRWASRRRTLQVDRRASGLGSKRQRRLAPNPILNLDVVET